VQREEVKEQEAAVEETAAPEDEAPQEEAPREELDPLAKAEAERDEYLELAQRTQADFENYRKRTAQQAAQAGERAKAGLLRELLPVLDNLERALAAAGEQEAALAEGVKLVLSELQGVLAREGVEAVEPVGEQFDPTVHEALSTRPEDGAEPGIVLDVVEKGYRSADTVIRPARVVVSA
jgi:molecular chaperone GrpE